MDLANPAVSGTSVYANGLNEISKECYIFSRLYRICNCMNVTNALLLPFQKKVAFRHGPLDTRHRSVRCCI